MASENSSAATHTSPAQPTGLATDVSNSLAKVKPLLKSKDDTQRFVGLALLKSLLDNTPEIRNDEAAIQDLWSHISPKFLTRLLRTGTNRSNDNAKDMLDIGVAILYTFSVLLPEADTAATAFTEWIPILVEAALYSTGDTTKFLLQLLYTLVSTKNGTDTFMIIEDVSPLTEIATADAMVLDVFCRAWLNHMADEDPSHAAAVSQKINAVMQSLVTSFKGTDAVTYLAFVGTFLSQADPKIIPRKPKWLTPSVTYIQRLVTSRPTAEARAAYTNAAAALLQAYPDEAAELLFKDPTNTEKPFGYLFINLLLIDVRSSIPTLLASLNSPEYAQTSKRLASAFDILCLFIGYLVRSLEDESLETLIMPPDSLLRLRKSIAETMSVTMEYIRDRWDAATSGAMGLDPLARASKAATSTGEHHTLAWDSMDYMAERDPFLLSSLRALALWLREDENDQLRREGTGLIDIFLELYQTSRTAADDKMKKQQEKLDFRSSTLVALEGLVAVDQGRELFLQHDGWQTLSKDLLTTLAAHEEMGRERDATRCVDVVRVLLAVAEEEGNTAEAWLDLITGVAAWDVPENHSSGGGGGGVASTATAAHDAHVAVLQLCCTVLAQANPGMRSRYRHSTSAISGVARRVNGQIGHLSEYREQMEDVLATLKGL